MCPVRCVMLILSPRLSPALHNRRGTSALLRKPTVKLAMRALVDAAHAGSRVAVTEGNEHPDERRVALPGEMQDEGEGSLRRRVVAGGQI